MADIEYFSVVMVNKRGVPFRYLSKNGHWSQERFARAFTREEAESVCENWEKRGIDYDDEGVYGRAYITICPYSPPVPKPAPVVLTEEERINAALGASSWKLSPEYTHEYTELDEEAKQRKAYCEKLVAEIKAARAFGKVKSSSDLDKIRYPNGRPDFPDDDDDLDFFDFD